jgi:putative MATE family efflux protein
MENNLTQGNILHKIFLFAIPMLISGILQQLFSTVDLFFVGNYVGIDGAAAVGASGVLITCLTGIFTGAAAGMGVIAARLYGKGEIEEVYKVAHTGFIAGLAAGFVLMVFAILAFEQLLLIFCTPAQIMPQALSYGRIYLLGIIPMVLYNLYSATLKAIGEARIPLYTLAMGGVLNIILDWIFIARLGWGVNGAGWATIISQLAVVFLIYIYFNKNQKRQGGKAKSNQYSFIYLKEIVKIGLPAGMQAVLLTFSNLIMQYYVNQLGHIEVGTFAAYFKIETVIYLPILAMGQTMMIFTGQNVGARKYNRVRKGIWYGLLCSIGITLLLEIIIIFMGKELLYLIVKDELVMRCGMVIISTTFPFYFLYAILDLTGNAARGLGNSIFPMISSIVCLCGIRILLAVFWASSYGNIQRIAVVYPMTWFLCSVVNSIYIYLKVKLW